METFRVGDVVELNSRGPKMTVYRVLPRTPSQRPDTYLHCYYYCSHKRRIRSLAVPASGVRAAQNAVKPNQDEIFLGDIVILNSGSPGMTVCYKRTHVESRFAEYDLGLTWHDCVGFRDDGRRQEVALPREALVSLSNGVPTAS